jgi:hypothetical protein
MTDLSIEQDIQAAGANKYPRITPADIEANIADEYYINAGDATLSEMRNVGIDGSHPLDLLTFCVLVLRNGFTVTGESACASPENFNEEIGRKIARQNAIQKIWPLMGYELRSRLDEASRKDACIRACEG